MFFPGDEGRIRVAVCDDAAAVRAVLGQMIGAVPDLVLVGSIADGAAAVAEVARRRDAEPVEVLLLDLEMPVMDGMTALPLLMRADPELRTVVVSTATTSGAEAAMAALRHGAADYIAKPGTGGPATLDVFRSELTAKVRGQGWLRRRARAGRATDRPGPGATPPLFKAEQPPVLLAIGASTGGPPALLTLIGGLGRLPVPVVVTQHMPPVFTPILARHIGEAGRMPCAEARDGQSLRPGEVVVAPGDRHLLVTQEWFGSRRAGLRVLLGAGPAEHFCRPAVDPMLRSAAEACAGPVLVVLLTGMGVDGLAGTEAVVRAGGVALAQNQASSAVWGMPGAIARAGLCRAVLPLSDLAAAVRSLLGLAVA